jgi:hypothetical protein
LAARATKVLDTHYYKEKREKNSTANRNKGDFSDSRQKDFVTVYDGKSCWQNPNERKKHTKPYPI